MTWRLPRRFTTLATRRALDAWDRENFGRRSDRSHVVRVPREIKWRAYKTLMDRRAPGRGRSFLYWRAEAAYLGHAYPALGAGQSRL